MQRAGRNGELRRDRLVPGGDRPQQDAGTSTGLDYSRAAGLDNWTLNINAPNLTNLGSEEQQTALVAQLRRALKDVKRGGLGGGMTA